MVRMVGENSISAGFISLKHRYRIVFSCTYISVRTYLLLCYLSVGSVSGHCFVGIRQTKEKPVPAQWITKNGSDISDDFIAYAAPLIQGNVTVPMKDGLPAFAYRK